MTSTASTTKIPKERPQAPAPRLQPRPTAASAARAARNASNRTLMLSPKAPKAPARPFSARVKNYISARLSVQTMDTKLEVKPDDKLDPDSDHNNKEMAHEDVEISDSTTTYNTSDSHVQQNQEYFNLVEAASSPDENEQQNGEISCETITIDEMPAPSEEPVEDTPLSQHGSRPQTPNSTQSSRPVSPVLTSRSRPATPSSPRKTASRPTTPKATRPKTTNGAADYRPPLSKIPAPTNKVQRPKEHAIDGDDLQTEYKAKQRQFHQLKKELDLKQHTLLQLIDNIQFLSDRMSKEGNKGACGEKMPIQDLVVFNVGDWTAEELARLCRDALTASDPDNAVKVIKSTEESIGEECILHELDSDISNLPTQFADLCIQAFTARQELIDLMKELFGETAEVESQYSNRIADYNNQSLQLYDSLKVLKSRADEVTDTVIRISRRARQERSALMAVGESLVREVARLRHDMEGRDRLKVDETTKLLEETRRAMEAERADNQSTKDKLSIAECQLRQTRARVTKMDRQLREAETTIASLTGSVKNLEDQNRQREVHLEARARKLKESLKTGEVTSSQLMQQRNALQAEIQTLKEQIKELTDKNQSSADQMKLVKDLKALIKQNEMEIEKERELRREIENKLQESQESIIKLTAKCNELEAAQANRPSSDLPSEREMDMWAELQATKDSLRMAEEEINACKREKTRFLETLTKISESESKVGIQQKLGAELLNKEEIINKMQTQIRDLTKNIRFNEQKTLQYEQYVRDLQAHSRALADCGETPNGISYQDLQQEVMDVRMSLLDAEHRNSELADLLAQKEMQLEQQDKTSRAQARVIKVREELINMLKNKETEQSRELNVLHQDLEQRIKIVEEVNKQIAAKADEVQELFATLESKQQQIHRLEKIVLALEEQQRRAQAQRTKHEEKIAALEHELSGQQHRADRKFLFF